MKFIIFRTSSDRYRPETPLDESKYKLKKIFDRKKDPNVEWSHDEWHYEINITSVKQLLDISKDVGKIIIDHDKEIPTIEIYDDYRE